MFASMMTDELDIDIREALPIIQSWGYRYVDLRGKLLGTTLEEATADELNAISELLEQYDMQVGMLHTSIGKVSGPENAEVMASQMDKAEHAIQASKVLKCNRVRIFPLCPTGFNDFGNLDKKNAWWDTIIALNEPMFRKFHEAGMMTAIENGAFHINDAINLAKAFEKYNAGIAWDLMGGWILRDQSEAVDDYFARLAPWIRNVHVKMFAYPGYEHNFEMGAAGETAGIIPWDSFLKAVKQAGGDGPLSVETQQVNILKDAPSMLEANRMLAEYVLNISAK